MRSVIIALFFAAQVLSSCSDARRMVHDIDHDAEGQLSTEQPDSGHAIGVIYNVDSSAAPHRQMTIFFNGSGLGRVLGTVHYGREKILVNFKKGEILNVDTETRSTEITQLNPYEYPPVINPNAARSAKAKCIGIGTIRSFPYHRWQKEDGDNEWEVWTDDRDHFPVYYRSVNKGEVTTWTLVNAWIDPTTLTSTTFFTSEPDPLPVKPIQEKQAINTKSHSTTERKKGNSRQHRRRQSHSAKTPTQSQVN